jgi:hypothetical protein
MYQNPEDYLHPVTHWSGFDFGRELDRAVFDKTGGHLPKRDPRKTWQRLNNCPACGHTDSSAVNYTIGWFECFHDGCKTVITASYRPEAVFRFRPQIEASVARIRRKYGMWVRNWDLEKVADDFVTGYARGKYGDPHDAGMLDEWEHATWGDPNQLDAYVQAALNADLKRETADVEEIPSATIDGHSPDIVHTGRTYATDPESAGPAPKSASKRVLDAEAQNTETALDFNAYDYPTMYAHYVKGLTIEEISAYEHLTQAQVKHKVRTEKAALRAAVEAREDQPA